jgi:hypothetical protein
MSSEVNWLALSGAFTALVVLSVYFYLSHGARLDLYAMRHPIAVYKYAVPRNNEGRIEVASALGLVLKVTTRGSVFRMNLWVGGLIFAPLGVVGGIASMVTTEKSGAEVMIGPLFSGVCLLVWYMTLCFLFARMQGLQPPTTTDQGS